MRPDLSHTRRSLTRRYSAFVAALLSVFALAVYAEVRRSREELLHRQVQQLAAEAAAQLPLLHHELDELAEADQSRRLLEQGHAATRALEASGDPGQRIRWFDDQRRELRASGGFRPAGASVPPAAAMAAPHWLPLANGLAYWQPVRSAPSQLRGYVSVAVASTDAEAELLRLRQALLLGIALAALLAVAAGGWLVAASLEPVRAQIDRLIRFTADASHELRHPLTATRALIGSLRHGPLLQGCAPELLRKLDQLDQTSVRMARLVDDLLLLSRSDRAIEDGGGSMELPLHELLEDLADLHQAEAAAAGLRLHTSIEAPARVWGHPGRLQQLLENLLSNALRFSPPGGSVTLGLCPGHRQVRLWVDDQGPGIPPEHRALVFERFWQADASRSGPDHHGLGLAIAQAIAVAHGGRLRALATPTGGCRMVLQLPALAS
jgi:signal transduction histidine kinase